MDLLQTGHRSRCLDHGHNRVHWLRNQGSGFPTDQGGCGLRWKPERGRGSASPTGALGARNLARFSLPLYSRFCSCWCCWPVGFVDVAAAVGVRRDQRSPASCLPSSDSRGVDASGVDLVTWG